MPYKLQGTSFVLVERKYRLQNLIFIMAVSARDFILGFHPFLNLSGSFPHHWLFCHHSSSPHRQVRSLVFRYMPSHIRCVRSSAVTHLSIQTFVHAHARECRYWRKVTFGQSILSHSLILNLAWKTRFHLSLRERCHG